MSEFAGKNREVLFSFNRRTDHSHVVAIVRYTFDDGSREEYVEVTEVWPDGRSTTARHTVTEAVHVLANVGDVERFTIANRSPHTGVIS